MGADAVDGNMIGKPLTPSLVSMLRMAEGKLHGFKQQQKAGQEYTLASISDEGEVTEPQRLDELIENWEKEKAKLEAVIAWAEAREPGSARSGDGVRLLEEYERSREVGFREGSLAE